MQQQRKASGLALLLAVAVLGGCSSDPPADGTRDISNAPLPTSRDGYPMLVEVPGLQLDYRAGQRDAVTAFAACLELLTTCSEPGVRSIDDCFATVPTCQTETPWEEDACCPAACKSQYADERARGVEELEALDAVLFVDRTCAPGLAELTGRGQ